MKAVLLHTYGTPVVADFADPSPSSDTHRVLTVRAASVNPIDINLASGRHPLSPRDLPVVLGMEGVGEDSTGRYYFSWPVAPFGSMAERVLVEEAQLIPLPDGLPDAEACTLGNAGLAAWMPFQWPTPVPAESTVLVYGGSGVVGRLAIQAARLHGHETVIVVAQDEDGLTDLSELGATHVISTRSTPDIAQEIRSITPSGVDLVLDYVGGTELAKVLPALGKFSRIVQIGERGGPELRLSSGLLRVAGASLVGFAPHHAGTAAVRAAYEHLCTLTISGDLRVPCTSLPLDEVEVAWSSERQSRERYILLP